MSLFTDVVKIKGRQGHTGFWDSNKGKFSVLNSIDKKILNPITLRNIQLGIIKKQMKVNPRLQGANEFIQGLPKYSYQGTEEVVANDLFSALTTILNSPFKVGDDFVRAQSDKVEQVNEILKTLNIDVKIPDTVIRVLNDVNVITKDNFSAYRTEKSQLFEEIAAAYIRGLGGNNTAITTGSWGKISDYNRQLITDIYAFVNMDSKQSLKGSYTPYQKTGFWKADVARAQNGIGCSVNDMELQEFIKEMDKMNGDASIGISINDELADTLDTISSLKIQAKSGVNQSILNNNWRNSITLKEIESENNLLSMALRLYNVEESAGFPHLYKNSKDSEALTAYANYLLSINIAKTSLLDSNDIYFTEHGFETLYDWMSKKDIYLKFQHGVKLNASLLSQQRKYGFNTTAK